MQSLKLGKTLDDGTTLNQYSQALASVGVNIKDSNGELKTMDTILDETMSKWGKLSADQRVALAQSVAGVRQYNQFISLMSNADFFKENVERAKDATGTLNEQNAIYAESWEAASKRVKTSIQGIYDDIIDDKWLIEATNNLATFISGIDKFIESIGGLKTIVPSIGGILLTLFANKIPGAINSITYNFRVLTGEAYKDATKIYTEMRQSVDKAVTDNNGLTESQKQEYQNTRNILKVKEKIAASQKDLTEEEKKQAEQVLEKLRLQQEYLLTLQKQKDVLAENAAKAQADANKAVNNLSDKDYVGNIVNMAKFLGGTETAKSQLDAKTAIADEKDRDLTEKFANIIKTLIDETIQGIEIAAKDEQAKIKEVIRQYATEFMSASEEIKAKGFSDFVRGKGFSGEEVFASRIQGLEGVRGRDISSDDDKMGVITELRAWIESTPGLTDVIEISEEDVASVEALNKKITEMQETIRNLGKVDKEVTDEIKKRNGQILQDLELSESKLNKTGDAWIKAGKTNKDVKGNAEAIKKAEATIESYVTEAKQAATHTLKFSEAAATLGGSLTSIGYSINNLVNSFKILGDESATTGEKISSIFMGITTSIPTITSSVGSLGKLVTKMAGADKFSLDLFTKKNRLNVSELFKGNLISSLKGNESSEAAELLKAFKVLKNPATSLEDQKELLDSLKVKFSEGSEAAQKLGTTLSKDVTDALGKVGEGSKGLITQIGAGFRSLIAPPAGVVMAVIVAITAIGAAIALTYQKAKEMSIEGQLERETATLERNKKAAEEAASSFAEFKSLSSDYQSAKDSLKDLTKGTEEYADALDDVNSKAKDLLEKFPQLSTAWQLVDGVIVIDKDKLSEIKQEQRKQAFQAEAMTEASKLNVSNLTTRATISGWDEGIEQDRIRKTSALVGGISTILLPGSGFFTGSVTHALGQIKYKKEDAVDGYNLLSDIVQSANREEILASLKTVTEETTDKQLDAIWNKLNSNKNYGFKNDSERRKYLRENAGIMTSTAETDKDNLNGKNARLMLYNVANTQNLTANSTNKLVQENAVAAQAQQQAAAALVASDSARVKELTDMYNDIEKYKSGLSFSNNDLKNFFKDNFTSDEDKALLKGININELNDKQSRKIYKEILGKEAEGVEDEDIRREIMQYFAQKKAANNGLSDEQLKGLDSVFASLGLDLGTQFSNNLVSAVTSGEGLGSFDWTNLFGKIDFEDLSKSIEEANGNEEVIKEILLKKLGLTKEQLETIFGANLGAALKGAVEDATNYVQDEQTSFETENGFYFASEEEQINAYKKYAKEKLKLDDEWLDKHKNNLKAAVIAEDKAQKARAKGLSDMASSVAKIDDIFDPLSAAYSKWKKKDVFDWGAFADDSSFGKTMAGITNGTELLSKFRAEMAAAQTQAEKQEAWNHFAAGIVQSQLTIADLTDATKEQIAAVKEQTKVQLKEIGFTIDEIDLETELAQKVIEGAEAWGVYSKENIEAALKNGTFIDSLEGISHALEEQGFSADVATTALKRYAIETIKSKAASGELDFRSAANQLVLIAESASISTGAITGLQKALTALKDGGMTASDVRQALRTGEITQADINAAGGLNAFLKQANEEWTQEKLQGLFEQSIKDAQNALKGSLGGIFSPPSTSSKSGSDDKKDKKEATDKEYEKELTRYYKLDKQYEKITADLEDISNAKEKAYGPKHLKNLDQEIKKTQELINLDKDYIKEIERYDRQDIADFNKNAQALGISASFTSIDQLPGRYEDYEAKGKAAGERITANFNAEQKAAVDRYNASTKDTAASERYDKEIKAAEDVYNAQMKFLKLYFNALQKLDEDAAKKREKQREIAEKEIEIREKRIEVIKYKVEMIDDATEAKETFLDLQKELSIYQEKNRINFELGIDTSKFENDIKDVERYTTQYKELLKEAGIGDYSVEDWFAGRISNSDLDKLQSQDVMEAVKEITSKIQESSTNAKTALETITQDYIDGLQRQVDELKSFSEKLDFIRDAYSGLYSIAELSLSSLGSKQQKQILKGFLDAETSLRQEALSKQAEDVKRNASLREAAEKSYREAVAQGDQVRIVETKKILDEITEAYEDAYTTWQSDFESLLNNIYDSFEKKVELIFSSFDIQYNLIKDKFDKTKSLSEDYMDDFQKMYEVNKLNADIQKSINETKNVKSKQELAALQEKINQKAKDQKKMSEYEVQALRKQYELKLAMQKLDEAQNAKSQVRLTRDAEGNFGYMYTADETEIASAQQDLNDKLYEYYKFNTDRVGELSDNYIELMSQMEEEIKALSLKSFESDAEYNAAVEHIRDFYQQKMDNIQQQMESALDNNKTLTEEYAASLQALGASIGELIDTFAETNLADALTITDLQEAFETMSNTLFGEDGLINKVKGEAADAFLTLGDAVKAATKQINGDGGLADAMSSLQNQFAEDKRETITGWAKSLMDAIGPESDTFKLLFSSQGTLASGALMTSKLLENITKLLGGSTNAQVGAAGSSQSNYNGLEEGLIGNPTAIRWETLKALVRKRYDGNLDSVAFARDIIRQAVGLQDYVNGDSALFTLFDIDGDGKITVGDSRFALREAINLEDFTEEYLQRVWNAFTKFDTGGYTGSWGSDGKLAMLHEKELVLNKNDTSNFLLGIEALREISKTLDWQSLSAQFANSQKLIAATAYASTNTPVQQNVHISASFPSVTDHNEIEMALNNLVNEAVQYTSQLY